MKWDDPVFAGLIEELTERIPHPVDALEVAAVMESMGITDAVAFEDYGIEDVFRLAELLFPDVLARRTPEPRAARSARDAREEAAEERALAAAARSFLALAPLVVLIAVVDALGAAGWSSASVLALSFGAGAGMLFASGPSLAIARRTAMYLGLEHAGPARRFVRLATVLVAAALVVVAAATLAVLGAFGALGGGRAFLFAIAFIAVGLVWLLVGTLGTAGAPARIASALALGFVAGVAATIGFGIVAGLAVGYAATFGLLLAAWLHAYGERGEAVFPLPSVGLFALEALPYMAYGSLFALFLVEPHVIGWEGHSTMQRHATLTALELSFTLALPPVLLASGLYERAMRTFWRFVRAHHDEDDGITFRSTVALFQASQLRRFALVACALSAATAFVVEGTLWLGGLEAVSQVVFLCGIGGFLLLGVGQLSCFVMLSLSRPGPALQSVAAAAVVLGAVGWPLASVDFRLAAPAFLSAAALFAALAQLRCRSVIKTADYHYANAF